MAVQRLPQPGQDDGTWGDILNGYLLVEHNADGTLKIRTDGTVAPLTSGKVPATNLGSGAASASTYLRGDGTWATPAGGGTVTSVTATDATVSVGGTANAPTIGVGTIPESKVTNLTTDLAAKAPLASPTFSGTVTVPTPVNPTDATTKTYVDTQVSSGTADATTSTKGKLQLAGDLAGTAAAPTVVKVNGITLPASAPVTGNVLTATSTTATAWSTPAAGVTLDATNTDIVAGTVTGSGVAGSTGKAADAGHQHPLQAHDHSTANKGGLIPVGGLSATGTASATTYLRGDGSWSAPSGGSGAQAVTPTVVKTGAYSASAGDFIPADATGGVIAITLPTAPADKSIVVIKKIDSSINLVTITAGGSDVFNKTGGVTTASLLLTNQAISLQYTASSAIWYVMSDDIPLAALVSGISRTVTTMYTMTSQDHVVLANATSAAFTITLPTAVGFYGRYTVSAITTGTNIVTLATSSSQTIDGASTTSIGTQASGAPWSSVDLISDGANWRTV